MHFQVLPLLTNIEVINFGDCLVKTQGAKVLAEELTKGANNLKVNILDIIKPLLNFINALKQPLSGQTLKQPLGRYK